ncbi:MAG: hypothetical protein EOO40_10460 [Deltaproteobacteria bacterium]|nr:MAG: hypothetical protein EOO40_10460 [Deltaproteobacteria bacterium]
MARKKTWDWRANLTGTSRRRDAPFLTLGDIELLHIDKVLQAYGCNFVHAAKALGISRATLYRKVHRDVAGLGLSIARPKKARVKLRAVG